MPNVVVYVPAAVYREIERLAPANGYENPADYVRALSLATLDELVTGVAMSREVRVASDVPDRHFKPDPKPTAEKKGRR